MKQPSWRHWRAVGSCLSPSPCGRMGVAVAARRRLRMGDTESYWQLGKAIARGEPYEYGETHARVFRTPGYPVLLAPIFWLTDDHRTAVLLARAEAALLGTLAVLGVWGLTRLLFDDRAALLAAVLATFYPGRDCLGGVDPQRGAVLPVDLAAIGAMGSCLERPVGRSENALRLCRRPGGRGGDADAAELAAVHPVCRGRGDAGGADFVANTRQADSSRHCRHRGLGCFWGLSWRCCRGGFATLASPAASFPRRSRSAPVCTMA